MMSRRFRLSTWRRAFAAWLLGHRPDPPAFVDLATTQRRQAIADWVYSANADADCRILRRSWERRVHRQVPGVTVIVRVAPGWEETKS